MSFMIYGLLASQGAQAGREAASAKSAARQASASAEVNAGRVRALEERADRLALLALALVEVLKSRTGATDEEILKQVSLVDLRDGVPDGRLAREAQQCGGCGRVISTRHAVCLFCGGKRAKPAGAAAVEALLH